MNTEKQTKSHQKFLQAAMTFSDKTIKYWKKETIERFKNREKTDAFHRYINWERKSNEIAVFTLYAFDNLDIPQAMNCIFHYDNPEIYVKANFVISQSISEGWFPFDCIESGHKHLCILTFDSEVPDIFNSLHCETQKYSTWSISEPMLGLCNYDDIQAIIDRRRKEISFKELHGKEYYWFDDVDIDGDA